MPVFHYRVRTRPEGELREGEMEGSSKIAVIRRLLDDDYLVISVEEQAESLLTKDLDLSKWLPGAGGKVSLKELAIYCRQLSTLINAGVALYEGITILTEQTANPAFKKVLEQLGADLRAGNPLHVAMGNHPKVFPEVLVFMVEAGELGGILDEIMERMADHFEKENDIRGKMKSALTYPVVILVVAMGAVVFILGFVMPTFSGMLSGFGAEMPAMTKFVLRLSSLVQNYWWTGLIAIPLLMFGSNKLLKIEQVRYQVDRFIVKIPILGELLVKASVSRFSRTLGTLIRSGVPIMEALDVVQKIIGNKVMAEGVKNSQESISQGEGMGGPLRESGVFPAMVIQMIAVGEETGAMDVMLEKVADYYEMEFSNAVTRLSTVIEPVMMVLLGGVIGFLVVSMLLPMFSLMENVG